MSVRLWLSGAAVLALVAIAVVSVVQLNRRDATDEAAAQEPATEAERYSTVNPPTARPATKKPAKELTAGAIIERTDLIAMAEAGELAPVYSDPVEVTAEMEKAVAEHPEYGECFGPEKLPEYDEDGRKVPPPSPEETPHLVQYDCAIGPPEVHVFIN